MKKIKITVLKRTLIGALALLLAISTPCVSLQAATIDPQFYSTVYKDVKAAYGTNAKELQTHYDVFGEKEGRSANLQDALEKKDSRSLVIYYLAKNASYYRKNGLNLDFPFFNADNYLKANPDVAKAVKNNKMGALEHYLTYGAIEGRGSGTAFDPIIAIAARPTLGNLAPAQLLDAWTKAEGNATTSEYTLRINFNQNIPIKYTATKKTAPVAVPEESSSSGDSGSSNSSPVIENKASFTLMVYLCGTDLESKEGNREATKALIKILLGAYDEENVNVTLLAGGTDVWKNKYMNDLLGAKEGSANKSALFTINKDGVRAKIDELLASESVSATTIDELYELCKDERNWTDFNALADFLINEETLNIVGEPGSDKMGDPATLQLLLDESKKFDSVKYGLSLWNHGGGSLEGVCFPDGDKSNGLTIPEIRTALQSSGFGATASDSEYKLGILAFDACLMAGAETAAYLNDYYDMMYGSEETTYGDIDYYHIINTANAKASDDYLSYWLAIGIVEDRLINYTGTENALATGALFESGKAGDSLHKLDDVASLLNGFLASGVLSADAKNEIYNAFKNARIKCEQIGNATTAVASKDYVDMKNFLVLLKSELAKAKVYDSDSREYKNLSELIGTDDFDSLNTAIDTAIVAADEATYATVFNYGGYKIFYNLQDSTDQWFNQSFWETIKNSDLCGANIYVPYFGALTLTSGVSTILNDINTFKTNYVDAGLGLENYKTFLDSYANFLTSAEEKNRRANLAKAMMSGRVGGTTVLGYKDVLSMSLNSYAADIDGDSTPAKMLTIAVKDYQAGEQISSDSSGDAFVDLFETMDTLLVYITRQASIIKADTSIPVDVVVGSKTVSYENINGMTSSINIFTSQFDETKMNIVSGSNTEETASTVFDFVTPSNFEGYGEKDTIISLFKAEGDSSNADDYMTVKGTALVEENWETVYHLFKKNGNAFEYAGSTTAYYEGSGWNISKVGATAITFYHQTVDTTNNKLAYAEELYATETEIPMLDGAKVYSTGSTISIDAVALKQIGAATDNGYYFAVSQAEDTNDDDFFVPVAKDESGKDLNKDTTYTNNDIFGTVDSAMGNVSPEPEDPYYNDDDSSRACGGDGDESGEGGSDSGEGGEEGPGSTEGE